jgi:hypothetical protein
MMNETVADEAVISEQVTYRPDEHDPVQVVLAGHTFHANLPLTLSMKASWFERLRNNRFFKVGPFDPKTDAVKVKPAVPSPKTPEQYRAHAVEWFKTVPSVEALDTRWAQEEILRLACGVGADDLDYLATLFRPKRAELRKREVP